MSAFWLTFHVTGHTAGADQHCCGGGGSSCRRVTINADAAEPDRCGAVAGVAVRALPRPGRKQRLTCRRRIDHRRGAEMGMGRAGDGGQRSGGAGRQADEGRRKQPTGRRRSTVLDQRGRLVVPVQQHLRL